MSTEKLLQMPTVRADCFGVTGFATYSTQLKIIKQNLRKAESTAC
jgi:hypothetical protein